MFNTVDELVSCFVNTTLWTLLYCGRFEDQSSVILVHRLNAPPQLDANFLVKSAENFRKKNIGCFHLFEMF